LLDGEFEVAWAGRGGRMRGVVLLVEAREGGSFRLGGGGRGGDGEAAWFGDGWGRDVDV